jgi:hypothetical protein
MPDLRFMGQNRVISHAPMRPQKPTIQSDALSLAVIAIWHGQSTKPTQPESRPSAS